MGRKSTGGKGKEVIGRRIDFLGYCFSKDDTRLRKSIKKRFAKKVKTVKNKDRRKQILASYWGWCKWGNCRHLWNVITDNDMSFADRGIKTDSITKDGKRFFRNKEVTAMDILNSPVVVQDFEPGITTVHGPGRYAILLKKAGEEEVYKYVSNSMSIKDTLDKARAHDNRLRELKKQEEAAREAAESSGALFSVEEFTAAMTERDKEIFLENKPVFPCPTTLRRRLIKNNMYDYYFE